MYREIKISDWKMFKDTIDQLDSQWIFRGQEDANWKLQTSLERALGGMNPSLFEMDLVEKFKQRAPHYIKSELMPKDELEWMALMQHHGAPTRLMDWTYSPYVAAYFSLINASSDSAVWALDYTWLQSQAQVAITQNQVSKLEGFHHGDAWCSQLNFLDFVYNDKVKLVVPLVPKTLNERQIIQQGLFLFGSNREYSFEGNLASLEEQDLHQHFIKIVLDKSVRQDALLELRLMNITPATLFPGLDGLAQSISIDCKLRSDYIWQESNKEEVS
ncbi:FRG domain-containing protein [Vibrio chagasii]|uniref:FRG domain-containing protein n=1 Tax=Vibrio chagasii TaxID=170679 RepID=UPI0035A61333